MLQQAPVLGLHTAAHHRPQARGAHLGLGFLIDDTLLHNVAGLLGHVLPVLAEHQVNVVDMVNKSRGDPAFNIVDLQGGVSEAVAQAIAATQHVIRVRVV